MDPKTLRADASSIGAPDRGKVTTPMLEVTAVGHASPGLFIEKFP